MPEPPMTSFLTLFIGSFNDPVLMVLIAAAIVSLVLGMLDPAHAETGWIEGAAIMIAVLIVAVVTSGNDYAKELQFRALAKFAQTMESCTVLRDGKPFKLQATSLNCGHAFEARLSRLTSLCPCYLKASSQIRVRPYAPRVSKHNALI